MQMWHGDIHCVTSYNFIEADLRSIVRPVDSRRGGVCVRRRMCAPVRAYQRVATYLQMALGCDQFSRRTTPS
ncbi:unnamed protein product, partial [Iphiclides podalirius]